MFCPCETSISVHDPQPNDQPYAAKLLDSVGIMVGITYSPKITRLEVTPGKGSFGVRKHHLRRQLHQWKPEKVTLFLLSTASFNAPQPACQQ
jgi:hypothetical protein